MASLDRKGAWKSQPWQPASSSMPKICARFSGMGRSRRAACAAIDTWYSWLAEVGMESIAGGRGALLVLGHQRGGRHLRQHEPRVQPRLGRQERRQPRPAPGPPAWRCGARPASRSSQIASAIMSAANATCCAWKLPPDRATPSPAIISGLSETPLASIASMLRSVAGERPGRAHHLRLATQAVGILHAVVAG